MRDHEQLVAIMEETPMSRPCEAQLYLKGKVKKDEAGG